MSKLEQLQTFIKVVECQGIVHAAEALHLSPPAVTKQIQNLERHLKTPLFDRQGRQLLLNEIGQRYYQEAVLVLQGLQQLDSFIRTGQKEVSGILKVRTIQYFAIHKIIPKLPEFLKLYPKLKLDIETIEALPDFWKDQVDVLYGVTMSGESSWMQKRIGSTCYLLVASPAYLKQFGTPDNIEYLKDHHYLTHSGRIHDHIIELKSRSLTLCPSLWFSNYESLLAAALEGLGFIWAHEYVLAEFLNNGQLVEFLPEEVAAARPIYLYYQSGQYIDPKIRAFVDFYG